MDVFLTPSTKKSNNKITQKLRLQVWELHIGPGIKRALCPLCNLVEIAGPSQNSGFQACHIVADRFMPKESPLTVFYLYPGCQTCNNECADLCLFDFLYLRMRYTQLRTLIWTIFKTFSVLHKDELSTHEGLCWRVLDYLYGPKRFPAGGSIENRYIIYEIARNEQLLHIQEESKQHANNLDRCLALTKVLLNSEIKPMRLT